MAIIERSVGTLPYLMTDFDQHSYEAPDAFTRFMPKSKLHTAVRPVKVSGYDRKVLLANDRIVTALENDLEPAALSLRPELRGRLDVLMAAGALGAAVSGSGPTCFGLFADRGAADEAAAAIPGAIVAPFRQSRPGRA